MKCHMMRRKKMFDKDGSLSNKINHIYSHEMDTFDSSEEWMYTLYISELKEAEF